MVEQAWQKKQDEKGNEAAVQLQQLQAGETSYSRRAVAGEVWGP